MLQLRIQSALLLRRRPAGRRRGGLPVRQRAAHPTLLILVPPLRLLHLGIELPLQPRPGVGRLALKLGGSLGLGRLGSRRRAPQELRLQTRSDDRSVCLEMSRRREGST